MCDFISLFMYFVNSKKSYIANLVLMIFLIGSFVKLGMMLIIRH